MFSDGSRYLTTGEAARLLAVTPDTVLKWIHRGRIPAVQTAGGHHRIEKREIDRLMSERRPPPANAPAGAARCWEYFGEEGSVRPACLQCPVYRFRAARCFEVQETPGFACGESRMCAGACAACPYYLRTHRLPQRILVVSRDEDWMAGLRGQEGGEVELAFAGGAYEAAAVVGEFLPGSVVLDGELPEAEVEALRGGLKRDRRIPWVRVFLAGGPAGEEGFIARQLRVEDLVPLVIGVPVEEVED